MSYPDAGPGIIDEQGNFVSLREVEERKAKELKDRNTFTIVVTPARPAPQPRPQARPQPVYEEVLEETLKQQVMGAAYRGQQYIGRRTAREYYGQPAVKKGKKGRDSKGRFT